MGALIPMPSNRRLRVEKLYHAALARDTAERAGFLHQACGEDEALRCEVASLLDRQDGAQGYLEGPTREAAVADVLRKEHDESLADQKVGRVGRYRLDRELGRGGMGVVYAAYDDQLERPVAIKMLVHAATDAQARKRLWREARAWARIRPTHLRDCIPTNSASDAQAGPDLENARHRLSGCDRVVPRLVRG